MAEEYSTGTFIDRFTRRVHRPGTISYSQMVEVIFATFLAVGIPYIAVQIAGQ